MVIDRTSPPKVPHANMDLVLAIDPSTTDLGWCIGRTTTTSKRGQYIGSGRVRPPKVSKKENKWDWLNRIDLMVSSVTGLYMNNHRPGTALIELPSIRGGVTGDAANNSSAIIKLAGAVFAIDAVLRSQGINTYLIPVNKWKGTTSKEMTQMRVTRAWGIPKKNHNEMDAIGIFDWYVRKHLQYTPLKV